METTPITPADTTAVTVIGGYLGAGKTTLVNHILATADQRIAVLVNDFGDINIDAALIESQDDDTIALANGCICCSLVDGFAAAMMTIADREPSPDRLVIEASGVADPATVAAYAHGPGLNLDAVVVVVDSETILSRAKDEYVGDTVSGQMRAADIVIANKRDLVDESTGARVEGWIFEQCPTAALLHAENAVVAPELLFGTTPSPAAGAAKIGGTSSQATPPAFHTWSWHSERSIHRDLIESLMSALPAEVVRAKGVVRLADSQAAATALQRVGKRWALTPIEHSDRPIASELVFIATHPVINDAWLADHLGPSST